jgi:hypothetical protein
MDTATKARNEKCKVILPPVGRNVLVQCEGFRGLAYLNSAGEWKSAFSNKILPKVFEFNPYPA